ncbi:DNA topoisomerase III [Nematocida minor]|uniref:DNA topoisomerase III n=1 Tax=Nematocida minor TaxID=1912983 RepID=UPI00221F065D|nr:DNA topoisomerase III [Nematocida minor]XP_051332064.1 DNA topoisomerase III [Nematocida minor]KAI5188794.1 DNA topoisomerase III [Nematocida minor]KAI5188898.1 DNA topoisomerase III [Nematocida minor]
MHILNVAEKPSVAKAISDILSNGSAHSSSGFNKYCRVFKFDLQLSGAQTKMVFTSVLGHLYALEFERKTLWSEVDPISLFGERVHWTIPAAMQDVSKTIANLSSQCAMLIIWTDCDREGENIGTQISNLVQNKIRRVKRARFSGLSKYEIFRALENLGELNAHESKAVESRIEIDLRIGAAITRLQTLQLQSVLENKSVISYGSCQIPTLGFVCEREESIENFIEEENWSIQVEVENNGKKGVFKWDRGTIYDEDYVKSKMEWIKDGELVVSRLETKKVQKWRPYPLRTVELQKFFAKGRGVSSSHELMNIAESLYTSGYISYPRTETDAFPSTFNYKEPLEKLKHDSVLGEYAASLRPGRPSAGRHNDQAHTPIYPMKSGSDLRGKERAVYEYVARRFLACYSENAEGEEELIECTVKGECFRRKTLKVLKKNYLDVFIYEKWGDTEIDLGLSLGQAPRWAASQKESKTEKPHLLTEAELIAKMDNNGIGTDATIHDHIHRIKERGYIHVVNTNSLKSTWLGRSLVNGYKSIGLTISEPHLRKDFECNLKKVCSGEFSPSVLVQQELKKYEEIYRVIESNISKFKEEFIKNKKGPGEGGEALMAGNRNSPSELENKALTEDTRSTGAYKKTFSRPEPSFRNKDSKTTKKVYRNHIDMEDSADNNGQQKKKKYEKERFTSKINSPKKPFAKDKPAFQTEGRYPGYKSAAEILRQKDTAHTNNGLEDGDDNSFVAQLPKGTIVCLCNIVAKEKKVMKEGPSKGKLFYACAAGQCDYFAWKDSATENAAQARAILLKKDAPAPRERAPMSSMHTDKVKCDCNMSAKYFLSKTARNNNRGFFKCNKSYKPCLFFKWEDEITDLKKEK